MLSGEGVRSGICPFWFKTSSGISTNVVVAWIVATGSWSVGVCDVGTACANELTSAQREQSSRDKTLQKLAWFSLLLLTQDAYELFRATIHKFSNGHERDRQIPVCRLIGS